MTTPEPQYHLDGVTGLYWQKATVSAGYRPSYSGRYKEKISLSDSFKDPGGVWFWTGRDPTVGGTFVADLTAWLARQPAADKRAVWIADPNKNILQWQAQRVDMACKDGLTTIIAGTIFDLGGIQIQVSGDSTVTVADQTDLFGWGLMFKGEPGLTLFTEDGGFEAVNGQAGFSCQETYTGCLVWNLMLAAPVKGQPTDLHKLGVSLRYFAPDRDARDGTVEVLRVDPLIPKSKQTLYASMDPLDPFLPNRSRLCLYLPQTTPTSKASFGSSFTTARGYGVDLTARTSSRPPGFVLGVQPLVCGQPGQTPSVCYFTPDGDFDLTTTSSPAWSISSGDAQTGPAERLLCGVNGTEYIGFPADGIILHFHAGQPAYAPNAAPLESVAADAVRARLSDQDPADAPATLTELGTTAWTWITGPDKKVHYYAQAQESQLYYQLANNPDYLAYFESPTALLTNDDSNAAFPMVGYAGLDPDQVPFARDLETRAIAPERRRQIALATQTQWPAHGDNGTPATDVTPLVTASGLAIGYVDEDKPWDWLAVGNTGSSEDGLPDLFFTAVAGPFRQAMMSDRLFMVLGHVDAVMDSASVAYQLTSENLALIHAQPDNDGVRSEVFDEVSDYVKKKGYPVYHTEADFDTMLNDATKTKVAINAEETLVFQRYAGLLTPVVGDWLFRMSPRNWVGGDRRTRLIFKQVADRSLKELVADTAAWTWPEAAASDAEGGATYASNRILAIIASAQSEVKFANRTGGSSPYQNFVDMVNDPGWTGVLALSLEVPLDTLPGPLQPLAAGIDPLLFSGHHLGLTTTGFTADGKSLSFDVTASFGLIDYRDPIDQYFSSDEVNFAFKVQRLVVGFENGLMSSFHSSAQLLVNRLFGTQTRLEPTAHGNNLMLDGVYQAESVDGEDVGGTYVFSMRDPGAMQLSMGQLHEVAIDATRMAVVQSLDPEADEPVVHTVFQLSGRLRFGEPDGDFDPFCWGLPGDAAEDTKEAIGEARDDLTGGDPTRPSSPDGLPEWRGLQFSNYAITMSFSLSNPTDVTFSVADDNLTLDSAHSPARDNSLFARFPLRLVELISTPDPWITEGIPATTPRDNDPMKPEPLAFTPESAGFVSISAPIQQGQLSAPWYGLVYEVDLGTLGALAGSVGITVRLLAAWSPGGFGNNPAVYIGAALPGVEQAVGMNLPLQGILDLGFRTLQFSTYSDANGTQYLLNLRDFGLHVLGMSFPPGHNDIILFGNPDQTSNTKLGWYAAYDTGKVEGQKPESKKLDTRMIRRVRPARVQGAAREET